MLHASTRFGVLAVLLFNVTLVSAGPPARIVAPKKTDALLDVKGQLLDTDPVDAVHNQPCKLYTVKLLKGQTYVIDMESNDFDAYLRLTSSKGDPLADDDDGGGDLNAQVVVTPEKEDSFKIIATRFDDDGKGAFRLRVRLLSYKVGKTLDLGDDGLKVDGQLTMNDAEDIVGPKHRYKLYSIKMVTGRNYTIDLESGNFDAFLRLHDSKFRKLAEDDDGGGDLNSRIVHRATADGVYHIIATTLDGDLGGFTLRIREEK